MAYLPELHFCCVCGADLGPDNGDGICTLCDLESDQTQGYDGNRYYCTVCHQNEVAALDGEDTCSECLARQ